MYILVVEDDARMAAVLARLFQQAGWRSDIVATAYEGIDCALSHAYDCAVVDVELPDGSGIDMVSELRRVGVHVPILILTVHDGLSDRVAGLTAGADDYLGKPFAPEELMARIQALVRRGAYDRFRQDTVQHGAVRLDKAPRTLQYRGRQLSLSEKEFALLEMLFHRPDQVITRDQLMARLWGPDSEVADNALDTYVYFLRKKCARLGLKNLIQTVRGLGYRLGPPPAP